jgi:hypothetical protein
MAPVRAAHGGNIRRVARGREPVVNDRSDRASADRRLPGALVAGDQQQDAVAARDGLLERSVDRAPCAVEAHAMKIDDSVRLDRAAA